MATFYIIQQILLIIQLFNNKQILISIKNSNYYFLFLFRQKCVIQYSYNSKVDPACKSVYSLHYNTACLEMIHYLSSFWLIRDLVLIYLNDRTGAYECSITHYPIYLILVNIRTRVVWKFIELLDPRLMIDHSLCKL